MKVVPLEFACLNALDGESLSATARRLLGTPYVGFDFGRQAWLACDRDTLYTSGRTAWDLSRFPQPAPAVMGLSPETIANLNQEDPS